MSEPFPDLLHGHPLCKEHRGAGVAQIVESDLLQVVLLQQLSEMSRNEVGIAELAECIHGCGHNRHYKHLKRRFITMC